MTLTNGKLTASQLVEVEKGTSLEIHAARAYRRLKAYCFDLGIHLTISSPGGGYRSLAVQSEMYRASKGDAKLAAKWNLNPHSSVPLAQPGYSSHGTGDRVDLLFDGSSSPLSTHLKLAENFGFTREFGSRDPNHFQHKGSMGTTPVSRDFCLRHNLFVQPQ